MKYRNVSFEVDIVGLETWRWTVLPRKASQLTFVGQVRGSREQAADYCRAEIDALLARETAKVP